MSLACGSTTRSEILRPSPEGTGERPPNCGDSPMWTVCACSRLAPAGAGRFDDQFALVLALLSPGSIALEGIYAAPFHNNRSTGPGDGVDKSYDEILRLLGRMGRSHDGSVFKDVRDFVGHAKKARKAEAVDHLIARARASNLGDPLCIIATAAISNIASALLAAPDIVDKIIIIWSAGHALEWPDTREFNLRQDVGGAQVLLDSGAPPALIPCMGVTSHLHSTSPKSNAGLSLAARSASFSYAARNIRTTMSAGRRQSGTWRRSGGSSIATERRRCLHQRRC
jgi:Inosine-uridine preferring nucleoside hydrolase